MLTKLIVFTLFSVAVYAMSSLNSKQKQKSPNSKVVALDTFLDV